MTFADTSAKSPLDVVIVNYGTSRLTARCVKSILALRIAIAAQIVVVDNCSGDDSVSFLRSVLPEITLVEADRNSGFAAGVNLGARALNGAYILILNPDTYFERNVYKEIIDAFEHDARMGVVGLDLINPDGSRQYSARQFYTLVDIAARRSAMAGKIFSRRIEHHLMMDHWRTERPFEADWVLGTGFAIRRTVYQEIGGMDERYFLYFEDVDLCARVWQAGYRVVALPKVCLVHDHQRSSAVRPLSLAGRAHLASLWRFTRKFDLPLLRQPSIRSR
jgi:N-acetylglucosaminyl-diphospho-decaprenol L-rhamnosyltransferase